MFGTFMPSCFGRIDLVCEVQDIFSFQGLLKNTRISVQNSFLTTFSGLGMYLTFF